MAAILSRHCIYCRFKSIGHKEHSVNSKAFRGVLVTALVLVGMALGAAPVAAANPTATAPGKYYLALGDSLGFGYQQFKVNAEMAAGKVDVTTFNTGYNDDFYRMAQAIDPGLQLVNYSCPGETSSEFVSSPGCPFPLHDGYATSQLQAAVSFLQAHPGQVNPITIDLGANDIERQIATCGGLKTGVGCVAQALPSLLKQLGANLAQVMPALRQAAPNAQIFFIGLYNPYAVADASTNALATPFNGVLKQASTSAGATFIDTFGPFNQAPGEPQTLCALTLFCTSLNDIHPSDAGYLTIAKLMWDASGYARLAHGFMAAFTSTITGRGVVYFGSGPGCLGLVEVATRDLQPPGTAHIVYVTGNDLPGTVGDNGIIPGVTYAYETVTISDTAVAIDDLGGHCYSSSLPAS